MNHYLEKITITNIRRFGENTEIEMGKGATIILAPNGTGKTAIFEAIELALTGTIKRLASSLDPIIRDKNSECRIRLDFNNEQFCDAIYKKSGKAIIKGNFEQIFGTIDRKGLPYLLRLTHLLNQSNGDWFVQASSDNAGGQLNNLDIGRDAIQANKGITSAKKAANSYKETANLKLNEAKNQLDSWQKLIEKRSTTNVNIDRPLVPLSSLLIRINIVSTDFGISSEQNKNLLSIKTYSNEVKNVLDGTIDTIQNESISLKTMDSIVKEYNNLESLLLKRKEEFENNDKLKKKNEEEISIFQRDKVVHLKNLTDIEASLNRYIEQKKKSDLLKRIIDEQLHFEANIPNLRGTLENYNRTFIAAKDKVEQAQKNSDTHNAFLNRDIALQQENKQLLSLNSLILRWNDINHKLIELENSIKPAQIISLNDANKTLKECTKEREDSINLLNTVQKNFSSINATTDLIRQAVGIIATNLPKDQGNCPVCRHNYLPLALHELIAQSINEIDPNLQVLSTQLDKAKEGAKITEDNYEKAIANNNIAIENLKASDNNISSLQFELTNTIKPKFPNCNNIEESEIYLNDLISKNENSRNLLNKEQEDSIPALSKEQLAILDSDVENINNQIFRASEELRLTEEKLKDIISKKIAIEKEISENFDKIVNINEEILSLEELFAKAKIEGESLKKSLDIKQSDLNTINELLLGNEKNISLTSSRINEIIGQWNTLRLEGNPSEISLNIAKENSTTRLLELEEKRKELISIQGEIGRWVASEEYLSIEEEIKKARGQNTEEIYANDLKAVLEAKDKEYKIICEKVNTLNDFDSHLKNELETVNERLNSINPAWDKLLKRIVIDPRFAETNLNSFSHYKKQHAEVKVPLHGSNTTVSHIASEAQITDLQLTFLLAMAQKYQWSPWRALLLDDPTQHHDLVHASAVFDLLRDYIAVHNFQILLATHDSIHAKFFMRKLENDGLQCRLYTLEARDNGVTAILNSY